MTEEEKEKTERESKGYTYFHLITPDVIHPTRGRDNEDDDDDEEEKM